jgi:hypothetical protein
MAARGANVLQALMQLIHFVRRQQFAQRWRQGCHHFRVCAMVVHRQRLQPMQ